jgi:4-hydroxyphenylpyruvate dioxygenase
LAWGRHINDHRQAWEIVRQVNHPAVGLALDAFSSLAPGIPIDSLKAIDPAKLFHVQISDAPKLAMDPLSWSRHFRCMPGQGELPLVEYVGALKQRGYAGDIVTRDFQRPLSRGSTADVALDGMRSIEYLLERGSAPDARRPTRSRVHRVLRQRGAQQLSRCCARWASFRRTSTFAKAVTRWRQGDINIVVNCEPEGLRTPTTRCTSVRVRDRPARRRSRRGAARGAAAGPESFRNRWAPANMKSRHCAAWVAASSIS